MAKTKIKSSVFFKSFKEIDSRLVSIIAYDVLFLLCMVGIIYLAFFLFQHSVAGLEETIPKLTSITDHISSAVPEVSEEVMKEINELRSFFYSIIAKIAFILIGAVIAVIFLVSLFKGLIWANVLKKKFDELFYKKFLFLNLLWAALWLIFSVVVALLVKRVLIVHYLIAVSVLFLYFTIILCSLFDKNKKSWGMVKQAFGLGIKKFHLFIIPYLLAYIILVILYAITSPISLLSGNAFLAVYMILFIIFLGWFRIYFSLVVKKVEKH